MKYTLEQLLPATLIPLLLALVFLVITIVMCGCYCRLRHRQHGNYEEMQGDNGQRHDNGHEGHQNGGGGFNQNGREN